MTWTATIVVYVPLFVNSAVGETLDRAEVARRLRSAGEHLGNAIAGYRDNDNVRAATGLFEAATAALDAAAILEAEADFIASSKPSEP